MPQRPPRLTRQRGAGSGTDKRADQFDLRVQAVRLGEGQQASILCRQALAAQRDEAQQVGIGDLPVADQSCTCC